MKEKKGGSLPSGGQISIGWQKAEILARTLSFIAIPVVVALIGWTIQGSITQMTLTKDYVVLAASILGQPVDEVDPALREWAVDLLNEYSPMKFAPGLAEHLKSGTSIFPPISREGQVVFCAAPAIEEFSISPNQAAVGRMVTIQASAAWTSCFRAMRLIIDGGFVYELGSPEFAYSWDTSRYTAGGHVIRLEVAAMGDPSWSSPSIREIYYALSPSE